MVEKIYMFFASIFGIFILIGIIGAFWTGIEELANEMKIGKLPAFCFFIIVMLVIYFCLFGHGSHGMLDY